MKIARSVTPALSPVSSCLVGVALAGLSIAFVATPRSVGADTPTIDVASIKPGMKGYGLTVFSGTEPEKFDVEVIDVLHQFRPAQDLILVKTIHPRLEKVKVVAGMSGSPIFLGDGASAKLAGAYAYGWSFGNEPIAGVTPIASMLAEVARPLSPMLLPAEGKAPLGATTKAAPKTASVGDEGATGWHGDVGSYSLGAHVKQLQARHSGAVATPTTGALTPVDSPLMISGMSERTTKELSELLSPLGLIPMAGGGGGTAISSTAPTHYVDGGAVAVQLMRGDTGAAATGTVTHVMGNKFVGFGHPMMELGPSALPMSVAKVLWILSSDQRSFKIAEPVRPLGTIIQDRQACIVGDESIVAPMVPMTIDLVGDDTAPKKKWAVEVISDRFMTPMWASFAVGDALGASLNDHRDASWTVTATIKIKGRAPMVVDDFGVSAQGVPGAGVIAMSRIGAALGEVLNNPWQNVTVEGIDTKIVVEWKRDIVRLRGAELLESAVEAGQNARVKLTLKPYMGEEYTTVVAVPIARELAGKEVELEVLPGWMATPDLAAPETLDQLVQNLQAKTLSPKAFVVQYKHAELGVTLDGHVASRLPGFAFDSLRSSSSTLVPEPFTPMARTTKDVGAYADGTSRLRLTVRAPSK